MSYTLDQNTDPVQQTVYQIRVKGHLGSQWQDWFGGLTVTLDDNGETLLAGPVVDQAALHGLLKKVRDLGMPLVSVVSVVNETRQIRKMRKSELNQKDCESCSTSVSLMRYSCPRPHYVPSAFR